MALHSKYDVLIVGGGMAGQSLGLALGQAGITVCIVDALPPSKTLDEAFDGRVSSFSTASANLLKALDIWTGVEAHAQPILDIVVGDGTVQDGASAAMLHFDHHDAGRGPLAHMIENRHFRAALGAKLETIGACVVKAPCRVDKVNASAFSIEALLSNGETVAAAVCVGAEGRESPLRQVMGIKSTGWSYGQTGIVATIGHERPHRGTAYELFLPSGPFAILPMQGPRSSIVWSERTAQAQTFLGLDDASFLAEVAQRFGDQWGALRLDGPRWSYPLSMHVAHRLIAPRFALLGDAAHVVHPIAGQGLNLALRDVAALAEVLIDSQRLGLDIGSQPVLERYEAWRRLDNALFAASMDGLNRLFSNDIAPVKFLRRLGLDAVDALPELKRFFMRQAAGDHAASPQLLRGLVP